MTTTISPCSRLDQDRQDEWESVEWLSLRSPISSTLDFRTNQDIGGKEAVLADLFPLGVHSARGGWIPDFFVDDDIREIQANSTEDVPEGKGTDGQNLLPETGHRHEL